MCARLCVSACMHMHYCMGLALMFDGGKSEFDKRVNTKIVNRLKILMIEVYIIGKRQVVV